MNSETEMSHTGGSRQRWLFFSLIAVVGLVPPLVYWGVLGRVPTVTPPEARRMLRDDSGGAVLIDVRPAGEFDRRHVLGARNWPLEDILAIQGADELPSDFRGRSVLLLCNHGVASAFAARHLRGIDVPAYNVRGGTSEWVHGTIGTAGEDFVCFEDAPGRFEPFPFHDAPLHEQLALVISGLVFKPIYTLLSLALVVVLWRSDAPDLVALRRAMIFFFLGENACAANYWFFDETSYLFEYLHGFGMMLCFGFTTYAFLEGLDRRVLLVSDAGRKCALLPLCGRCIKHSDVPCGVQRLLLLVIPACIVLAFMPITADWQTASYNSIAFGTLYNYSHPIVYQYFEWVYCPLIAVLLLSTSLGILLFKRDRPLPLAKAAFAAGADPLGFALFRVLVTGPYGQNLVWRNFWEECTELLFIAGVAYGLWLFRGTLFRGTKGDCLS